MKLGLLSLTLLSRHEENSGCVIRDIRIKNTKVRFVCVPICGCEYPVDTSMLAEMDVSVFWSIRCWSFLVFVCFVFVYIVCLSFNTSVYSSFHCLVPVSVQGSLCPLTPLPAYPPVCPSGFSFCVSASVFSVSVSPSSCLSTFCLSAVCRSCSKNLSVFVSVSPIVSE